MSLRRSLTESINKWIFNAPSDPRDIPSRKHHTGDRSAPGKFVRRKIQKEIDKRMPRGFKRKRPQRWNPSAKRQKFRMIRRGRRNARRVTRMMRRLGYLREELKLEQQSQGARNIAYDNAHLLIPQIGIAQGDGVSDRDGRKIYNRYFYIKGDVLWDKTTTAFHQQAIRVRVIWVRNTDNAAFAVSEVYEDTAAATDVYSFRKARSTQPFNFKVLYDKLWRPKGDMTEATQRMQFKKYFKINRFTNYSGSGSAETDIANGKLCIHFLSNVPNASSPPQITYNWRLRFQDA